MDVTLTSSQTAYTVSSITVSSVAYQNIALGSKATVTTTVNVNLNGNELSGNPGYVSNKPLMASNTTVFELESFVNADRTCSANGTNPTGNFNILFNQPVSYTCNLGSNVSTSTGLGLAIDDIVTRNYSILKYGSIPSDASVSG